MAKLWSTGPALLYAGVGGNKNTRIPLFLGTAETKPNIQLSPAWEPVKNDLGGTMLPFDRLYEGEEGMVSAVLTRWNWTTLLRMQARPDFSRPNAVMPGENLPTDLGTMMGQEGMTFPFWVVFPYATTKAAMTGMPVGYRFWACILEGPDIIEPGTGAKKVHIMVRCQRAFTSANSPLQANSVGGSPIQGGNALSLNSVLYDWDTTGLPAID